LSTKQFRLAGVPLGIGARIYLSPNYHFYLTTTDSKGAATVVLTPSVSGSFTVNSHSRTARV
jgi:hypothetical protein